VIHDTSPFTEHDPAQHRPIEAPRFSLRTLLLVVTLLSILFAVMSALDQIYSVILVWALLLVAAHVAANAWGTRQRRLDEAAGPADGAAAHLVQRTGAATIHAALAPATRLGERMRIDRYMIAVTCLGACAGGIAGGMILERQYWQTASLAAIVFGACSSAVLGGFFGFLVSSFLRVALKALHEATREPSGE
jgi:MFS family permease